MNDIPEWKIRRLEERIESLERFRAAWIDAHLPKPKPVQKTWLRRALQTIHAVKSPVSQP